MDGNKPENKDFEFRFKFDNYARGMLTGIIVTILFFILFGESCPAYIN